MVGKRGPILITCQNPECDYFQIEEGKDITKNGHNPAGNQQYFCHHCRRYFIETKNTPLYNSHLSRSEIQLIAKHSMEKPQFVEFHVLLIIIVTQFPNTIDSSANMQKN
jgi:hypothetical protein